MMFLLDKIAFMSLSILDIILKVL